MLGLFERNEKKQKVDERAPISEARYVVFDTELTGLDDHKDSIVSIGAVRMTGGNIDIGNTFYRLVSPHAKLSAASVVIHEITPSDVEAKPAISDVLAEFLEFCGDAVLVGHFVSIDLSFLNREMVRAGRAKIANPAVDTFSIYEWLRKRNKSRECPATALTGYRLYDIAKCFDISVNGAHNALADSFITAQLLQRFLPQLAGAGAKDIGDLISLGIPFKGGDWFGLSGEFSNF